MIGVQGNDPGRGVLSDDSGFTFESQITRCVGDPDAIGANGHVLEVKDSRMIGQLKVGVIKDKDPCLHGSMKDTGNIQWIASPMGIFRFE